MMGSIRLLPSIALAILLFVAEGQAKLVEYTFDISYITVNYTGKDVKAMAVGGTIPATTIEASIGDTLRVTFNNKMDVASSVHWHGVLLPNDQDGVPYLTTPPIEAGGSFTYEFPVIHSGTYWYHSHTGLQEQRGVYGSIVFHPREEEPPRMDHEHVVVLSDWTDENPSTVLSNLKKDGDYYALKKGSVQSWNKVIRHGWAAVANRLRSSWTRMGPMDISDVGYDAFLVNGRRAETFSATPGETVLIRLINSAASTYFNVEFAGGPMTIVAADGPATEPLKVKRLRIAIAETYDLLLSVSDKGSYELRATSEDGTGHASIFIGSGEHIYAPDISKPNLYLQDHHHHSGQKKHTGMMSAMKKKSNPHKAHGMGTHGNQKTMRKSFNSPVKHMKDYSRLVSKENTSLPLGSPQREIPLELTGTMDGYTWSFNGETLSQADKILIRRGENVRFTLKNMTMMHHPIHLHGHFFRVLNGQGERSPLKHTVNVPAMDTVVIEFEANADRDWFFHCHNLYHMMAGMARVISYEKSSVADESTIKKISHDASWYTAASFSALTSMTEGSFGIFNTENALMAEYEYGYDNRVWEIESYYKRRFGRFFSMYAGADFEREGVNEKTEKKAMAGIKYLLPMFIESDLGIRSGGEIRFEIHSGFDLTPRTDFEWEWETDFDGDYKYEFELSWELSKALRVLSVYDSDHGWNAGLRVTF